MFPALQAVSCFYFNILLAQCDILPFFLNSLCGNCGFGFTTLNRNAPLFITLF